MISERRSDASPDAEAAVVLGRILSVTALENVRIVRYRRPIAVVAVPPVHSQIRHETASGRIPKKLDLRKQRALVAETVVVEHISHTERDFGPARAQPVKGSYRQNPVFIHRHGFRNLFEILSFQTSCPLVIIVTDMQRHLVTAAETLAQIEESLYVAFFFIETVLKIGPFGPEADIEIGKVLEGMPQHEAPAHGRKILSQSRGGTVERPELRIVVRVLDEKRRIVPVATDLVVVVAYLAGNPETAEAMLAVGSHAVERLRGGRLDAVDVLDVAPAPVMVDVHPPLAVAFLRRGEIGIEHALQRSAYAGLDVQRTEGPIVIQIDLHGLDRRHAEPLGDRPWRHREIDLGTQRDRIDHIGLDTQLRGGIHRRLVLARHLHLSVQVAFGFLGAGRQESQRNSRAQDRFVRFHLTYFG